MNRRIERVDIEKSISQVFKYRFYKEKECLPIIILEDGEVVDLSEYKANVYFKFPNDNILSFPCLIIDNVVEIPLKNEHFTKEERVIFEIVFTNDNQRVTTFKMYLDV